VTGARLAPTPTQQTPLAPRRASHAAMAQFPWTTGRRIALRALWEGTPPLTRAPAWSARSTHSSRSGTRDPSRTASRVRAARTHPSAECRQDLRAQPAQLARTSPRDSASRARRARTLPRTAPPCVSSARRAVTRPGKAIRDASAVRWASTPLCNPAPVRTARSTRIWTAFRRALFRTVSHAHLEHTVWCWALQLRSGAHLACQGRTSSAARARRAPQEHFRMQHGLRRACHVFPQPIRSKGPVHAKAVPRGDFWTAVLRAYRAQRAPIPSAGSLFARRAQSAHFPCRTPPPACFANRGLTAARMPAHHVNYVALGLSYLSRA
jgi:hypothetical protein